MLPDDPFPCAVCLQPVEDAQVQVLFKHSKVRQPSEGEWKLVFVHEACFTPVMHKDYRL